MAKIVIYTSPHCPPCQEIKDRLAKIASPDIEVVDIETDEGFKRFSQAVLEKGDGAVPSAFVDGRQCKIMVTPDDITLDCPDPVAPANSPSPS